MLALPRVSWAQESGVVLFFCDEEVLGGCAEMGRTLKRELADFGLGLVDFSSEDLGPVTGPVPGVVEERAEEEGAVFAVWFSGGDEAIVLHVYDRENRQVFTRIGPGVEGEPDYKDLAFRIRNLMGASLYSDLEDILDVEGLLSLAIPEEKREVIEEVVAEAPERRSWVSLGMGYELVGYPLEKNWYHGFGIEVALVPVERLDVFIDGGVFFLHGVVEKEPVEEVRLEFENRQVLLGLGARYAVLRLGPVDVAPEGGFRLGISMTHVAQSVSRDFVRVNPALWCGLMVRISIGGRFAFTLGMRFEDVFRYETFKWGETRLFSLSPFRFSAGAGILVRL